MDRPLLILLCTQRPRRHFSASRPLAPGSRARLHQVVQTRLYKLRRNLPLQMAFLAKATPQQVVRDGKHMLPRQCVPQPPTQWSPHGGQRGLRASRGYSWGPGRRSECTGCQISSGSGSLGEVKFSILYLPGGGDPPAYSWFSFRTLAFKTLPPMCKVRNTPWW